MLNGIDLAHPRIWWCGRGAVRRQAVSAKLIKSFTTKHGEVSERFKEHAWKACVGEILPWVRIPPSPPESRACFHVGCHFRDAIACRPAFLRFPQRRLGNRRLFVPLCRRHVQGDLVSNANDARLEDRTVEGQLPR